MERVTFLLKSLTDWSESQIVSIKALKDKFDSACLSNGIGNFSIWKMGEYMFGYCEAERSKIDCFESLFNQLPADVISVCKPGSMRLMYHNIGRVREDKSLIRHRVFATRLHPGCENEYKRRHDGLIAARGSEVSEGPESNFTIWYGDGCIFGYCELVRAYDAHVETPQEHQASVDWETKGLEIMDWITDDVDWLTSLHHEHVEKII